MRRNWLKLSRQVPRGTIMNRKEFVELCLEADYPIRRIGDLPEDTKKACIELARQTANKRGKFLRDLLPFVMHLRGTSGKVELTVLIERENEII